MSQSSDDGDATGMYSTDSSLLSFPTDEDTSVYMPTPQKELMRSITKNIVPNKLCFANLIQLDKFVKQINKICQCRMAGCSGSLAPLSVKTTGLGGAGVIEYICNGCVSQSITFESSGEYEILNTTESGIAVIVTFIISGCTYATYNRVLKQGLGIDAFSSPIFSDTIG